MKGLAQDESAYLRYLGTCSPCIGGNCPATNTLSGAKLETAHRLMDRGLLVQLDCSKDDNCVHLRPNALGKTALMADDVVRGRIQVSA